MIEKKLFQTYIESINNQNHALVESIVHSMYEDSTQTPMFRPIGQQAMETGIRYYEIKKEIPPRLRYLDVTSNGIQPPSEWIRVDFNQDELKVSYTDVDGIVYDVTDIEYKENMGEIPIKPQTEKNKKTKNTEPNEYLVWHVFSENLIEGKTKHIKSFYTSIDFPKRSFFDKLRALFDMRVSYNREKNTIIVSSKDNDNRLVIQVGFGGQVLSKNDIETLIVDKGEDELVSENQFMLYIRQIDINTLTEGIGKYIAPLALSATVAFGNPQKEAKSALRDIPKAAEKRIELINSEYDKLGYDDKDVKNKRLKETHDIYKELKAIDPGEADAFARIINRHLRNIIDYKSHQLGS